ncbi:MAG TPA: cytidylate kinase-like family protein [Acidimicrobiales bacterium]|nr:cytidylate kinase-like family protein [Acidimicrobiales bacterium]
MSEVDAAALRPAPGSGSAPLVVTISASYGAAGSVIAPRLAERLGVPWLDRMVSASTASESGSRATPEHLSDEEAATTPGSRLFTYLARAVGVNAIAPPDSLVDHDEELRAQAESDIGRLCADGGVLLGRAGAVVLADRPATVHLRLDGPVDRRVRRAVQIEGIDAEEARRRMADTDRARTLYVRRLYHADPTDPRLYNLVVDTTVLTVDAAVGLLADAVTAFRGGSPGW